MEAISIEGITKEHLIKMDAELEIDAYAQSIVDPYTGEILRYEMLARGSGPLFSPVELSCRMGGHVCTGPPPSCDKIGKTITKR